MSANQGFGLETRQRDSENSAWMHFLISSFIIYFNAAFFAFHGH